MATAALVQANIDAGLKSEAEKILAEEGLTLTDAIRMLLIRTVREQGVPSVLFTRTRRRWKQLKKRIEAVFPASRIWGL